MSDKKCVRCIFVHADVCVCFVDSVVLSPSNQTGDVNVPARDSGSEGGALPSVYDEAGTGADNATYCQGVQPITIEPMDCETDFEDVEPMTYTESLPTNVASASTSAAPRQNTSNITRPGADGVTPPAMRVFYCGTVSGNQLMEQNAFGELAQNLISSSSSSALASGVHTAESSSGRKLSDFTHGGTVAAPVSVECTPSNVGGAVTSGRMAAAVQQRNVNTSTLCQQQLPSGSHPVAPSSSESVVTTSRKSTKQRRARSLDTESSAVRHRSVTLFCVILTDYIKAGFHYPSSQPELTVCQVVNTARQLG